MPIVAGVKTEYVYNASGQRDSLWNGANNTQIQGQYYWNTAPIAFYKNGQLHFQHQDWMGTERERTTYNGTIEGEYSNLPFGDAQTVTIGTDLDPYHFAMMDYDSETNTDHAQFRQYSPMLAQWMAPDPYSGSYDFSNPQSFNRYSYVTNSPLAFADPNGLEGGAATCLTGNIILCAGAVALDALLTNLLFRGPSFHGSLHPRPNATGDPNWNGNFGESLGIGTKIPQGNWGIATALGLPNAGCDFGACGSIGDQFQNGDGQWSSGAYPNGNPDDVSLFRVFWDGLKETIFGKKPSAACIEEARTFQAKYVKAAPYSRTIGLFGGIATSGTLNSVPGGAYLGYQFTQSQIDAAYTSALRSCMAAGH